MILRKSAIQLKYLNSHWPFHYYMQLIQYLCIYMNKYRQKNYDKAHEKAGKIFSERHLNIGIGSNEYKISTRKDNMTINKTTILV